MLRCQGCDAPLPGVGMDAENTRLRARVVELERLNGVLLQENAALKVGSTTSARGNGNAGTTPAAAGGLVAASFEAGTLGIKFQPVNPANSSGMSIKAINVGTQAAAMPQLHPGLVLVSIQDGASPARGSLKTVAYTDIIGMLGAAGRPLNLHFEEPTLAVHDLQATAAAVANGFCSSCGTPRAAADKFCAECGQRE